MSLPIHPLCQEQPEMKPEQYQALKSSILRDGLIEPATTWQGQIIDGRHRKRACEELEEPLRLQALEGELQYQVFVEGLEEDGVPETDRPGRILRFVKNWIDAKNVHRRHQSKAQRACLAALRMQGEQERALDRKRRGTSGQNCPEVGRARDILSREFAVSARYIEDAHRLLLDAPDLFERIKRGEEGLSINQAIGELNERGRAINDPPHPPPRHQAGEPPVTTERTEGPTPPAEDQPEEEEPYEDMRMPDYRGKPELPDVKKKAPWLLDLLPQHQALEVFEKIPWCQCGGVHR